MDERFSPILRADLVLRHGDERVIIELKRRFKRNIRMSIAQGERYMLAGGIRHGSCRTRPALSLWRSSPCPAFKAAFF